MRRQVLWAALPFRTGADSDLAFDALLNVASYSAVAGYSRIPLRSMRTDQARHEIQKRFMQVTSQDEDVLVMVDADHTHPANIVQALVQDDKPVVAALSFRRGTPPFPCIFRKDVNGILQPIKRYPKGLISVDALGFPAVAIKRGVFKQLEAQGFTDYPHFSYTYPHFTFPSDDMFFSQVCNDAGVELWCDTRVVSPHITVGVLDESSWEQYRAEHTASGGKVSVIVPAETDHIGRCIETLQQVSPECEIVMPAPISCPLNVAGVKKVMLTQTKSRLELWDLGVKLSKGDTVVLVDDRAEFEAGWLENALSAMESFPDNEGLVLLNDGAGNPLYMMCPKTLWKAHDQLVAEATAGNHLAFAAASIVRPWSEGQD